MPTSALNKLLATAVVSLFACRGVPEDPGLPATRRALSGILATMAAGTSGLQVKRKALAFWEPASVGVPFMAGDWVQSGPGDRARIEFLEGGRLEVDESALVVIDTQALDQGAVAETGRTHEALLAVESGVIRGVLREPGQSVGIRGADGSTARLVSKPGSGPVEYRLAKRARGTEVAIRKGNASLTAKKGVRELTAGDSAEIAAEAVGPVVKLLPAPELSQPAVDAELLVPEGGSVALQWKPVTNAAEYRVQVSAREDFAGVQESASTQLSTHPFRPAGEGHLFWRVASLDPDGRVGEFGPPRRMQVMRPGKADLLVAPEDGTHFAAGKTQAQILFRWKHAPEEGYRLVVAKGDSLDGPHVVDEVTLEESAELALPPGNYRWGVYAVVEGETGRPLFIEARELVVRSGNTSVKVPKAIREWGQ